MEAENDNLKMPQRSAIVDEVIERMATAGVRSSLLKLPRLTLHGLCMCLTDRMKTTHEAAQWLNNHRNALDDASPVNPKSVYRFNEHVCRLYDQIRSEHAVKLARMRIESAGADTGHLAEIGISQLVKLTADKLMGTDSLDQLSTKELRSMLSTLIEASKTEAREQELAIKVADAERRERRLEAELGRVKAQTKVLLQVIAGIPQRIKDLINRVTQVETARDKGLRVGPETYAAIRDQLVLLGQEADGAVEQTS